MFWSAPRRRDPAPALSSRLSVVLELTGIEPGPGLELHQVLELDPERSLRSLLEELRDTLPRPTPLLHTWRISLHEWGDRGPTEHRLAAVQGDRLVLSRYLSDGGAPSLKTYLAPSRRAQMQAELLPLDMVPDNLDDLLDWIKSPPARP